MSIIDQKLDSIPLWRSILKKNFTKVDQLADFLELTKEQKIQINYQPNFPLQVPFRIAKKMEKGTLEDPLVRQFLPLINETEINSNFSFDPVCDARFQKSGKLLQKYNGRVLLLCSSACAMHCRFCFRQNFSYDKSKSFDEELGQIKNDLSISEVILSGGDPLSLSNEILDNLLSQLSKNLHLKRIRFHTRFPIGIPERIDEEFIKIISKLPQQVFFVIHSNHPKELDSDIFDRLKALQTARCVILNSAVLLKGVNDNVTTLKELSEKLINQGVFFYYLNQLDRVHGTSHFEVTEDYGRYLVTEMAKSLPGYAVPKYVREIPGEENKTIL